MLLLDWHDADDEDVDIESETDVDDDFDLKSLNENEPSRLINLDPNENELRLGTDCFNRDSTKFCCFCLAPAPT